MTNKTKKSATPWIGGNAKGHFSNKWNRAAKLNTMLPDVEKKMLGIAQRGRQSNSESYRAAVAVLLMMHTGIRVGNERSAEGYVSKRHNQEVQTYGLTTLTPKHVGRGVLKFVGKREVAQVIDIPKCVEKDLQKLAKQKGDTVFGLTHYQLTKFVHRYVGGKFMPKDFRTVVGCRIAAEEVAQLRPYKTKTERRKQIKGVTEAVAYALGNTAAMAKRAYINPELLEL